MLCSHILHGLAHRCSISRTSPEQRLDIAFIFLTSVCATEEVTPTAALGSSASGGNGRPAAAALAAPTLTAAPPTAGPDSDDGMVEAWGAASDMPLSRESIGAGIIPLNIEREMWQSFAAVRRQRALRLIKAAAGLVR